MLYIANGGDICVMIAGVILIMFIESFFFSIMICSNTIGGDQIQKKKKTPTGMALWCILTPPPDRI